MQLTVSQYAKIIGKSRWTVYRMIEKGLPKGVKVKDIAGRKIIELK